MPRRPAWLPAIAIGCLLTACTDVDPYLPEIPPVPPNPPQLNTIQGTFCAEDPSDIAFPLKIWFIIDDSGSMQINDANQNRFTAMKELAVRLDNPGRIYFGGEKFADMQATRFTNPRFIDHVPTFNAQVDAVTTPGLGATPYLAALEAADRELRADVKEQPADARRTRYVVIFLSDGNPTDSTRDVIISAVDTLMTLRSEVGGINLNTVYLGGGDGAAEPILQEMALHGGGTFKSFPNGDQLDFSDFDFTSLRRTYVHRMMLVTNRSVVATKEGPAIDSDQDGLSDADEQRRRTSPLMRDTDGDGCNDLLEVRLDWDPLVAVRGQCSCPPAELIDTDGDQLNDCEEKFIGTRNDEADSDVGADGRALGDFIPDGLDFIYMAAATYQNTDQDNDIDGVLDIQELLGHTDVHSNDVPLHQNTRYRYGSFNRRPDEPRCFDFGVDNITLARTRGTAEHPANENVIELYLAQAALDDPFGERIFRRATKLIPFTEGGLSLQITPADFSDVLGNRK